MLSPKVIVFLSLVAARKNASDNSEAGVYEALWTAIYEMNKELTEGEREEARTVQKVLDSVSYFGWICKWVTMYPR